MSSPVTICTVVNVRYRDRLVKTWPKWLAMRGLNRNPFIVFSVADGAGVHPDLSFIQTSRRVRVVKFSPPGDTDRERCLSTFIFGVAQHVQTPYWMKLDSDCRPKRGRFNWPDYEKHDVVAHRCRYTKVKGDVLPILPGDHWLNRLDRWWEGITGDKGIYPLIDTQTHRHDRFASFCAIYKTANTVRIAGMCGSRLPIPSEDTITSYVAQRLGWKVLRRNQKRWFDPNTR